ncbi:MAG: DUF5989 family protein, partial [Alphaproteobacteria bacterium]|nr:DUF5989 family protein [Alphaproteobacteria bacterium]
MGSAKATNILGVSAYYHDSAAALLKDGELVAAVQQERFSRKKHDARFPREAISCCLEAEGLRLAEVDRIVFYDKPLIKFERLLETYASYAPRGFRPFVAAMPVWLKEKLYLKSLLRKELAQLGDCKPTGLPPLLFAEHHQSHAASVFCFSPFERAAVLCLDGVGEWATTSTWLGAGASLEPLWEIDRRTALVAGPDPPALVARDLSGVDAFRPAREPGDDPAPARHRLFRYDLADGDGQASHGQGLDAEGVRSEPGQLPRSEHQEPEGKAGATFLMLEFLKDFWAFMRERKKFWLAPIILVMILLGALIV